MNDFDASAPVIVGVGEASRQALGVEWTSPTELASTAIKTALADSGRAAALADAIDCLAAIRTFEDSGIPMGVGAPDNVPDAYAKAAKLSPEKLIYADVGGQSPQTMVNALAGELQRGEIKAAVIAGAEAMGTAKRARKAEHTLDWNAPSDREFDNQLSPFFVLNRAEIRHGVVSMPLAYSLLENARRIAKGMNREDYVVEMARGAPHASAIALSRQHAQFARAWTVEEMVEDHHQNYQLTDIYRRWKVAQDAVDLGAACILTTAGTALEMGIAPEKLVWLAGTSEAAEPPASERANLAGSDALKFALHGAWDQAGVDVGDLGPIDIYSCFPVAILAALDIMGEEYLARRDFTLTGGLTFFGGPGNGYSMHAIAAMVQALRKDGSKPAMITANGGVMSKQAVGIYTAQQPEKRWAGEAVTGYVPKTVELNHAPTGKGKILTHMRPFGREGAGGATLILEMEDGSRAMGFLDGSPAAHLDHAIVDITGGEKRHLAMLV